jgi:hypothetical protein
MSKINLPSILTEDTHFYKDPYKRQLEPFLGRPYISYSTMESWNEYREDFIKEKLVKLPQPFGIYKEFGSYLGGAYEAGVFPEDNPYGFIGQENIDWSKYRNEGAEYEKLIIIDRGDFICVGFIDKFERLEDGSIHVQDLKSGGAKKEDKYSSDDYKQVTLYSHALEELGEKIGRTDVLFIRRENSHVRPPLKISKEQFYIPITHTKEKVDKSLKAMDKAVKEISETKTVFDKFFRDVK